MASHRVFDSVEELLDPTFLSEVAGADVVSVQSTLLTADFAHSGSELSLVECTLQSVQSPIGAGRKIRFILKRLAPERDWLMRITEDDKCRSVALWAEGILDRLPSTIDHCIVGAARDAVSRDAVGGEPAGGEAWAILMRDVGEYFVTNQRFTAAQGRLFTDSMAAMHAEFFEDTAPSAPEVGLSELKHVFDMFAPRTALRKDAGAGDILKRITDGWRTAREVCPPDVMEIIDPLLEDPSPLVDALMAYPTTLIHGDFRHSNLAVLPPAAGDGTEEPAGSRVALLDWQLATLAPPAVELGRYIGANSPFLPESKEALLENYRVAFAEQLSARGARRRAGSSVTRFSDEWWIPQLELGFLGGFVQDGWAIALKATTWHVGEAYRSHWLADLDWWAERVRRGARRLG